MEVDWFKDMIEHDFNLKVRIVQITTHFHLQFVVNYEFVVPHALNLNSNLLTNEFARFQKADQ